jgi:hypothetical protein
MPTRYSSSRSALSAAFSISAADSAARVASDLRRVGALTVWNLGDVLGLGGLLRLVPPVVLTGAVSVAAFCAARSQDLKRGDEPREVTRAPA